MRQSQMFETSKVAMYPSGRWVVPTYRQSVSFNWTAEAPPSGNNIPFLDAVTFTKNE
ncbi:hypothetical protein [Paenibacillus macquariensis]|nr:hypothetical protein [Paenibacillus macquariensis]MEC0091927.1 hypothetical protein [Paenibacillus macquariensis]